MKKVNFYDAILFSLYVMIAKAQFLYGTMLVYESESPEVTQILSLNLYHPIILRINRT